MGWRVGHWPVQEVEVDKPGILVVMEDMLDQVMVVETLSSGCYCGTG